MGVNAQVETGCLAANKQDTAGIDYVSDVDLGETITRGISGKW